MKFFIAIFGCILALFAAGIVRPQTLETTKKKPGSDPVKCWSYSDNDVYFRFAAADAKAIGRAAFVEAAPSTTTAVMGRRAWR